MGFQVYIPDTVQNNLEICGVPAPMGKDLFSYLKVPGEVPGNEIKSLEYKT